MLKFNSAAAASAIYAPPVSKQYIIWNNSGYTITIYNSTVIGNTTAAGTGIAIADGDKVMVWSDATNFYDTKSGGITGTVGIANGGTGQTTANKRQSTLWWPQRRQTTECFAQTVQTPHCLKLSDYRRYRNSAYCQRWYRCHHSCLRAW
jgi:hypothetical protein